MCASALRRIMSKDQNTITPTPCFWAQNTIHCLYVLRTPHCGHIKHGIKPPLLPKYQFPTCVLKIDRLPNYVRVRLSRSHRRKSQRVQASSACVEIVRLWIYKLRHLFAFTLHLPDSLSFTKSSTNKTHVRVRLPCLYTKIPRRVTMCCCTLLRGAQKTVHIKYMVLSLIGTRRIYRDRCLIPKTFCSLDNYLTPRFQKIAFIDWMSAAEVFLSLLQDLRSLQSKQSRH